MIVYKVGNKFPNDCGKCPIWNEGAIGESVYCPLIEINEVKRNED